MDNEIDRVVIDNIVEDKLKIDSSFSSEDLLAIIATNELDNNELIKEIRDSNEMEGIAYNDAEINDAVVVIVGKKLLECTARKAISAYEKVTFITTKDENRIYVVPLNINVGIRVGTQDVDVQHPLPVDGDSVYEKDINLKRSSIGGFSGTVIDLFNDANNVINDLSSDNPKSYTIYFKRPITTSEITLAAGLTGNFSNAKLLLYDIAGNQLLSIDNSTDNTKYTKYVFNNVPQTFIGYTVEFHTTDEISMAFNYIHKSTEVQANIKVLDTDTGILTNVKGHAGHSNSINYIQNIGHDTAESESVEVAIGKKSAIGSGAYELIQSQAFVQPSSDNQMYIISTSIEDAVGGTGAQKVVIEYFEDAWGERQIVEVIPNGTTLTIIPVANINRIHKVYTTIGNNAVGNITITDATELIVYGGIDQYESFMRRCIFYLAENESVTLTQAIISSTTSGGVNFVIFATDEDENQNTITRGQATIEVANAPVVVNFEPWITITNPHNLHKAVGGAGNGNLANQKGTITLFGFIEPLVGT